MDVDEPYHPDRILRQFGRVQTIPSAPLLSIRATQGPPANAYHIAYQYFDQVWETWNDHLLFGLNRSTPVRRSSDCVPNYMDWYAQVSWKLLQNPNLQSNFRPHPQDAQSIANIDYEMVWLIEQY